MPAKFRKSTAWVFSTIPTVVWESDLTAYEKLVLAALQWHSWPAWPGIKRLARMCSLNHNVVTEALQGLVKAGVLHAEIRPGYTNRYHLLHFPRPSEHWLGAEDEQEGSSATRTTTRPPDGRPSSATRMGVIRHADTNDTQERDSGTKEEGLRLVKDQSGKIRGMIGTDGRLQPYGGA